MCQATYPRRLIEISLIRQGARPHWLPRFAVAEITLTVIDGPHTGEVFTFAGRDNFIVGRESPAHFLLAEKDATISRVHFMIAINPPLCRVTDLGSRNGTFVNGEKATVPVILKDGDRIGAGKTVFRVSIRQAQEPTIILGLPVDEALAPPLPPELLPPGYEWVQDLGQGGMGKVFLARALNNGRLCAIKTIRPRSTPCASMWTAFCVKFAFSVN